VRGYKNFWLEVILLYLFCYSVLSWKNVGDGPRMGGGEQ